MTSVTALRDMLAQQGKMDARQLSQTLNTPLPMIEAMLMRLEAMGKAKRVQDDEHNCLSGSCKSCPEGKKCHQDLWVLEIN